MTIAPTLPGTPTEPTTTTQPTTTIQPITTTRTNTPTRPTASATSAPQALARNAFPVGARFPRRTPDTELGHLTAPAPEPATNVVRYPIGARFPRRDTVTVVMLIDGRVSSAELPPPSTSTSRAYPIGARFPRRRD